MALKLNSREIPLVNFRRVLPAFLGPDGEECFIEVDARAGGAVNQPYLHAAEKLLLTARVMDRKNGKIEDDKKAVQAQFDATRDVTRRRFGVIYDACVIEWRSNILDGGDPIKCDRENFIELTEAKVPEISAAMTDLEREILEAGKIVLDETEGLKKKLTEALLWSIKYSAHDLEYLRGKGVPLDDPQIDSEFHWSAFHYLRGSRAGGMGPGAIPFSEIMAYADFAGITCPVDRYRLVRIVNVLDRAERDHHGRTSPKH